jgi:hypothetical protein
MCRRLWHLAPIKNWLIVSSGLTRYYRKIGFVAYKLLLPEGSTIHPVLHVSQLKGVVHVALPASPLPVSFDGLQVPERILQKRVANTTSGVRLQALIQWSGLPAALASWEDIEALRQCFPRAPAWGQAGSYQGGDVSNTPVVATEQGGKKGDVEPERGHDVAKTEEATHGPKRGTRARRPNMRVQGPEWA